MQEFIQLWTGIPAQKVIDSDIRRLADLEKNLKAKIIGQDGLLSLSLPQLGGQGSDKSPTQARFLLICGSHGRG